MSEFQYVGFRALDAPLNDSQLRYMRRQSTRAEVTRWSFDNVYHYGDFSGNAGEMMRRGYDVHFYYADFGIRTVMLRLPRGLPGTKARHKGYIDGENVTWKKDARGVAGTLTITASAEPGVLAEIWDADKMIDRLAGVRQQLIDGDLRPLYVAWLCGCQDDYADSDVVEPPIPAGLAKPSGALLALLECFDVSPLLLTAAAERSPSAPKRTDQNVLTRQWLASLDEKTSRRWLSRFLTEDAAGVRAECEREVRRTDRLSVWPTVDGGRTLTELAGRADELAAAEKLKKQKSEQRAQKGRADDMAKSPQKYLKEVDRLVAQRGGDAYRQAAQLLADLSAAVGGDKGARLARRHAAKLKEKHPTLKMLGASLRRQGLI